MRASPDNRFRRPDFPWACRGFILPEILGKTEDKETTAPVVVLVMDKERQGDYQKMVQQLRAANIRAEMYAAPPA